MEGRMSEMKVFTPEEVAELVKRGQQSEEFLQRGRTIPAIVSTPDTVNPPPHYTKGGVECIDAIRSSMTDDQFAGYLKGNVMKYLWRLDHKGTRAQDSKKAQWYMNKLVEVLNGCSSEK